MLPSFFDPTSKEIVGEIQLRDGEEVGLCLPQAHTLRLVRRGRQRGKSIPSAVILPPLTICVSVNVLESADLLKQRVLWGVRLGLPHSNGGIGRAVDVVVAALAQQVLG